MSFPKQMVHPGFRKGSVKPVGEARGKYQDFQGTPDVFPPVVVQNEDQEEYHRSIGYMAAGERITVTGFQQYPVWLRHDSKDPVMASNSGEEAGFIAAGFTRQGRSDPGAVEAAAAAPYIPGQEHHEFPKMVDGRVVDPEANKSGFQEYPKWVQGKLVNSRAEEDALTPPPAADVATPVAQGPAPPVLVAIPAAPATEAPPVTLPERKPGLPADTPERQELTERARAKGIKVHPTWGVAKIRKELERPVKAAA